MTENRGWGKTVLGWFVVHDEAGATEAPAEGGLDPTDAIIQRYAGSPGEPSPVELKGPLPPVVNGTVDFEKVLDAAGVDATERDQVEKALELLRALPAETPAAVKRQIVEASLKAFGVPTAKIIEAAVQHMEAFEGFIRAGQAETQQLLTEGSRRTNELQAEIVRVKQAMEQAVAEQTARARAANGEKLKVQQVLEFFGQEAVAKVVQESPRLHSPSERTDG